MHMAINAAGQNEQAGGVDLFGAAGELFGDRNNPAATYADVGPSRVSRSNDCAAAYQ